MGTVNQVQELLVARAKKSWLAEEEEAAEVVSNGTDSLRFLLPVLPFQKVLGGPLKEQPLLCASPWLEPVIL